MINKLKNRFKKYQDKCRVGSRNYPVDDDWDELLNLLLDSCKIINIDNYRVTFEGGTQVWIACKWYGYGRPESVSGFMDVLPSPTTAIRLHDAIQDLKRDYIKQSIKDIKASIEG